MNDDFARHWCALVLRTDENRFYDLTRLSAFDLEDLYDRMVNVEFVEDIELPGRRLVEREMERRNYIFVVENNVGNQEIEQERADANQDQPHSDD